LNDFPELKVTLESLGPLRKCSEIEWIVIDGGSEIDDASTDIIEKVKNSADHFISEPDKGIYDAMNKGTRLASGDYILYLNAGDELSPGFEPGLLKISHSQSLPDMIWGRCEVRYQDGTHVPVKTHSPAWAWYCMPAFHPAIFFGGMHWEKIPMTLATAWLLTMIWFAACLLLKRWTKVC
jgi:glycosyltransferase involved in cell wall biosynthesis